MILVSVWMLFHEYKLIEYTTPEADFIYFEISTHTYKLR